MKTITTYADILRRQAEDAERMRVLDPNGQQMRKIEQLAPDVRNEVRQLLERMGSEGEFLEPADVEALWGEFSGYWSASWLLCERHTFDGFVGWLAANEIERMKAVDA